MQPNMRPVDSGILILDFGSQYTLLITRRLRELGFYAEVIDGDAAQPPKDFHYHGLILSGGPDSVLEQGSRRAHDWVWESETPLLGICYGMQLIVEKFGGKVQSGKSREYGKATLNFQSAKSPMSELFHGLAASQVVWMSHGDDLASLPAPFTLEGKTSDGVAAFIAHAEKNIAGLQFHPEVKHSQFGLEILQNFCHRICEMQPNWDHGSMLKATCDYITNEVGSGHVLIACSGGVDSTVAAALLAKALGPENVTAVFCDHGLLRKNEMEWVSEQLKILGLRHVEVLHKQDYFLNQLKGVKDPEEKRKIIGRSFIEVFEAYAKDHSEFTHLGQGTLYPDVIESAGHGSGAKVIKSHHNVGGLPDKLALKLCEPLRYLFKDEVRALGVELGLPHHLVYRHPFPGPGLGIRILGEITKERLDILREADDIYIRALRENDLYDQIWQAFAALLPVHSVGVMGDNRTYQMTIALRAVTSSDAMTAEINHLPWEFLSSVSTEIVQKVDGVNRVVYDITSKPPATIEWE